jgi:dolichyl-phosphate beta-glucosyltransferase
MTAPSDIPNPDAFSDRVALIIPCFNEASRIDLPAFVEWIEAGVQLVFVDDGSTDDTSEVLRRFFSERTLVHIVKLPRNSGKAEAVRSGMLYALDHFPDAGWLGFWDADLSAPTSQLALLMAYTSGDSSDGPSAVWGSRLLRLGADIRRSTARHALGRAFALSTNLLLGIKAYDTQCGAKIFKKGVVRKCFAEPFITDWIFDLEIFFRLRPDAVVECPLSEWHSKDSTRINFVKLLLKLPKQFSALRGKYLARGPQH